MKTKNFFAGHRSGGRAERFKKMENNSFKNLFGKKTMIFITFLTLFLGFTTNAWADNGIKGSWDSYTWHSINSNSYTVWLNATTDYWFRIDYGGTNYDCGSCEAITRSNSQNDHTLYKDGSGDHKIYCDKYGPYVFQLSHNNGPHIKVVYPDGAFHEIYAKRTVNGTEKSEAVSKDLELGNVTSFVLNDVYLKCWDNFGQNNTAWNDGASLFYRYNGTNNEIASTTTQYKGSNSNNYEFQKTDANVDFVKLVSGGSSTKKNSGNYTIEVWGKVNATNPGWGEAYLKKDANTNFTWTFTILPPAVSNFGYSATGAISGDGTEANPYLVQYGSTLKLTATGSQATTDDNSALYASWGGSSYTNSAKQITVTSEGSITVKAKYYNSTPLSGTETSTKTIYYQAVYTGLQIEDNGCTMQSPSTISANQVNIGSTVTITKGTPATGYEFKDITVTSGGTISGTTWTPSANNQTATVNWKETKHTATIAYKCESSSIKESTPSGEAGIATTTAITALEITGYTFSSWTPLPSGASTTDALTNSTINVNLTEDNLTITANYERNATYDLVVKAGTHVTTVSGGVTGQTSVPFVQQISATAFDNGYEFNNWTASPAENAEFASSTSATTNVTVKNGSVDVTANAKATIYTITYNGLEGGNHSNPATYTIETATITLTDASRENYTFEGWFDAATGGSQVTQITHSSTGDKILWARWHETTYLISASTGTGIQSIDPVSQQVGNVTEQTFTATLKTGYTWANWTLPAGVTGTATNNPISVKATAEGTITANATENMTTVSVGVNDVNMGSVDKSNVSVGVATTATLTATKKPGYKFKMWTLGDGATLYSGSLSEATITIKGSGVAGSTGTATATFEEDLSTGWYFVSSKFSWESTSHEFIKKTGESTGTIGYCTITMALDEAPEFKIGNGIKLYANSGDKDTKTTMVADNCSGWTFDKTDGDYANSILKATIAGEYTIAYNSANKQVSVTYPQGVYLVGNFNSYAPTHPFVFNGNEGTVTVNLSEKNHVYDLKICDNGVWYRDQNQSTIQETCDNWQMEKHMDGTIFHIESKMNGNYVFTYNKETKILGVTYPGETKIPVTVYLDGETASTVEVGEATHPTIEAVQYVNGKRFAGWQADDGVTLANANDRITQITAVTGAGKSVRATYTTENMVYFKNTSWGTGQDIYVYLVQSSYNIWWGSKDEKQDGPGVVLKKHDGAVLYKYYGKMTRLNDKSNIYYYQAPDFNDISKVVFTQGDQHESAGLYKICAAYRTDFNSCATMFVPETSPNQHENETGYYNRGYWMKYGDIQSGYSIYVKDGVEQALVAEKAGDNTFKTTINLVESNKTYEFKIHGCNGSWYGNTGTMTNSSCSGWNFYGDIQDNCKITTTTNGNYTFILTCGDGVLSITVEYPLSENDYRVVYTDNTHPCHPSTFIRKGNGNKDTVSFFVDTEKDPALKFQYCSKIEGSTVTWTDVVGGTINISGITETGIYNFNLEQSASSISCTGHELYDGDFYIRTAIAPGGWDAYLGTDGNTLPYIEYGLDDSQPFKFTHAYTNWVEKDKNVKFCIANDYSLCISDTLVGDNVIGTGENADWLKNGANIRFMWNKNTNEVKRAYISGSTNDAEKFLMLENTNSKMYDKTGNTQMNELKFDDKNNWVYQADIQAQPGCAVKLTAQYTTGTTAYKQYFIGSETESKEIISGTGDKKYKMRAVYDFKTNRLTAGWIPDDETIDTDIKLGGDMLLVREHQGKASQITFGTTGSVSDIHHIYSVLTIKKDTMLGKVNTEYTTAATNTDYKRTMYWISFPFDVKISEVFGVDGYGKKWIMQRYNGEKRAEIGWFQETETFWEYLAPTSTLKAYKGYLLILNANYFNTNGADVWKNSATEANFYFPSAEKNIGIINKSSVDVPVPAHVCGIDRPFADDENKNHKITDSYWNVIGVPAFQDAPAGAKPASADFKSYYAWVPATNTYSAEPVDVGTVTFKTMHAYMVQFGGTLTWSNVSVVSNQAPYQYADNKNYRIELFFGNGEAEDHTYINLADEAHTDFVLNEDMMKIDNAGFPNIYSFAGAYDVAYNETTFDNQSVMLGVSAPKDGSYTFAMPKDFSGKAVLVDLESGEATDLNLSNYTVELNKGTYNNRFQLLLEVEAKAPTAIDNAKGEWSEDGKTKKLFINDNIYLINAGRVYNASGTKVR